MYIAETFEGFLAGLPRTGRTCAEWTAAEVQACKSQPETPVLYFYQGEPDAYVWVPDFVEENFQVTARVPEYISKWQRINQLALVGLLEPCQL